MVDARAPALTVVEELHCGHAHLQVGGVEVQVLSQVQQIGSNLLGAEFGRRAAVEGHELIDGAQILRARHRGVATQPQVTIHPIT